MDLLLVRKRTFRLAALAVIWLACGISVVSAQCFTRTKRVLWVGDGWSYRMWQNQNLSNVFDQYGHADKIDWNNDPTPDVTTSDVDSLQTSVGGTTETLTAQNALIPGFYNGGLSIMDRMTTELTNEPTIDIVLLSLGLNDWIAGMLSAGGPNSYNNANNQPIADNIQTLINAAKGVRSNIDVVIMGYDYVGLYEEATDHAAGNPWHDLWYSAWGNPSPDTYYNSLVDLESRKKAIADADPRVYYVHNFGVNQYYNGWPLGSVAPGTATAPTSSNFPGGLIYSGSRVGNDEISLYDLGSGNFDPYHLNTTGYTYLCDFDSMPQYFLARFTPAYDTFFESDGGSRDGYTVSTGSGTTGTFHQTASIYLGDSNTNGKYRSILSFNTSALPDNAVITNAWLTLGQSGTSGGGGYNHPFTVDGTSAGQGIPVCDVKSGFFGTSANLEDADWQSSPDQSNVGCFVGSVSSLSYLLRIDLNGPGRGAISKTGTTQFKFYFPNSNGDGGNDYVTFYNITVAPSPELRPRLYVKYDLPTPTPTATPSSTRTATATPTSTITPSPTRTATRTPTGTITPSPTRSTTASETRTATPTSSSTITPSPTASPSPTPSDTQTPTPNASRNWELYG